MNTAGMHSNELRLLVRYMTRFIYGADEIDGARECRRCHRLHSEVIDSGMSSRMVRGSSGRVRVPRHLANGRAQQQVSNLFSLRAKQELYAVTPPSSSSRPSVNTRM